MPCVGSALHSKHIIISKQGKESLDISQSFDVIAGLSEVYFHLKQYLLCTFKVMSTATRNISQTLWLAKKS